MCALSTLNILSFSNYRQFSGSSFFWPSTKDFTFNQSNSVTAEPLRSSPSITIVPQFYFFSSHLTFNTSTTMSSDENNKAISTRELPLWSDRNLNFFSVQDIFHYIENLDSWLQIDAIERLRQHFVRLAATNELAMSEVYEWVIRKWGEAIIVGSKEAWRPMWEANGRMRKKKKEGEKFLAGGGKWCSQAFWDEVLVPLTGVSTDVIEALRKVRKQKLKPLGVLRRACMEMYRRLNEETDMRKTKDKFVTAKDIRTANLEEPLSTARIDPGAFYASKCGYKEKMTIDEWGFIWVRPPQSSIADVVKQQEVHEAQADADDTSKPFNAKETVGQYNLRKRPPPKDDEDDLDAVDDPKKIAVTPVPKTAKLAGTPAGKKTTEMDKIFNRLSVVKDNAQRSRSDSMKKKGKSAEKEWPSPVRLPVPVNNPTKVQQSIWEIIDKRARAIKERRTVDISKEAAKVMKLPAQMLVDEIEPIAKGLSNAKATEDTVLVYTQCLLDAYKTSILSQKARTDEMSGLRTLVAEWHLRYRERHIPLIPGSVNQGGVQIDHYDMTSLLLGDGYNGWLNGEVIHGVLNLTANREEHYIVPARAWQRWHNDNHPNSLFHIPDHAPSLAAMVHWGNHWAMVIADRRAGLIHYLDSAEIPGRRQMAVASMRGLLNLHPQYNNVVWRESNWRSSTQTNNYDCGVWAIVNTWSWMEGVPGLAEVGLTDRLQIGRVLRDAALRVDQTPMAVPTDEVEYLGRRTVDPPGPSNPPRPAPSQPNPPSRQSSGPPDLVRNLSETARLAQLCIEKTPSPARTPQRSPEHSSSSSLSSAKDPFSPSFEKLIQDTLINTGRQVTPSRTTPQPTNQPAESASSAQGQSQLPRPQPPQITPARTPQRQPQTPQQQQPSSQQTPGSFAKRTTRHGKEY